MLTIADSLRGRIACLSVAMGARWSVSDLSSVAWGVLLECIYFIDNLVDNVLCWHDSISYNFENGDPLESLIQSLQEKRGGYSEK